MVTRSHLINRKITVNNRVAVLVTAAKAHKCDECGWPILQGMLHYVVTLGGAGLGNLKFPDRVHIHCIEKYLKVGGSKCPQK